MVRNEKDANRTIAKVEMLIFVDISSKNALEISIESIEVMVGVEQTIKWLKIRIHLTKQNCTRSTDTLNVAGFETSSRI